MKLASHILLAAIFISLSGCTGMKCQLDANKAGEAIKPRLKIWLDQNACKYNTSGEAATALMLWFDLEAHRISRDFGLCSEGGVGQDGKRDYWADWYYKKYWGDENYKIERQLRFGLPKYRDEHCK